MPPIDDQRESGRPEADKEPKPSAELTKGETKKSENKCDFWHVLPVRYALCHRGLTRPGMRRPQPLGADLPSLNHFDYTLRKLRVGWVHLRLTVDGVEEHRSYYHDGTDFIRSQVDDGGAETVIEKFEWIKIPKKALWAYMAFSPARWTPEAWESCMKSTRMQHVEVDPAKWNERTKDCALIDELSKYVEEFKEFPDQLCSLVDWQSKVFDTPPIKKNHANDKGRTKDKDKAIKARWEDSAEEFKWIWIAGGKPKLQDDMEKACPSPNDAYFVALIDPVGCTQDMAKVNVSNTQILTLYNSWYGYPQLIAEMAERYIKSNDGKDKKEVLALRSERGESYSGFMEKRKDEAWKLEQHLDAFFDDWEKYLKPNGQWRTETISILADEYPKETNRAEKKTIAIEREFEFARCITMICAHNKGKEIVKSCFFDNKGSNMRHFKLLQEILAGGDVPSPPAPDHDTEDRKMPTVINPANDSMANILISIRTAMLDLGNQADKTVYRELMDMAANRLSSSVDAEVNAPKDEDKTKFFPPVLAANQSNTVPITLNEFGMLLERCMRQIQEPADQWIDWTQEMPKPTPDKSNNLVEFAQISSIVSTTLDAIGYNRDLTYIKQHGTFPAKGSAALSAFKAFKGIALPIAIIANAEVLSKDGNAQNITSLANLLLTASLSVSIFADAVTLFKPTLLPKMIAASGGKLSQDAAMKIIQANTARFIGGIGAVVQSYFDMANLYSRDEVIETKVGLVFSCLGQLLILSFNPFGIALGFVLAIGGTMYSCHFRRGFEDDWFRTCYWGKDYYAKVGQYPTFSLEQNRIDPALVDSRGNKIDTTISKYNKDISVLKEFQKTLESYIYYGQSPNVHIYVENSDAYVAIVAPTFKHGHTNVYFQIERVDKAWKQSRYYYLKGLDEDKDRELKGAISYAERKADEAIAPSVNRYSQSWKYAYNAALAERIREIDAKYEAKKRYPWPRIDWSSNSYYKVPMRMRIVEGAACCEMVLDLNEIAKVGLPGGSANDVTLELIPFFTYEKGMKQIALPIPNSKTFRATDGVEFVPSYQWKKHKIEYRNKPDFESDTTPYYFDPDVFKWGHNRYHEIIKNV